LPLALLEVSVTLPPAQNVVPPLAPTVGVGTAVYVYEVGAVPPVVVTTTLAVVPPTPAGVVNTTLVAVVLVTVTGFPFTVTVPSSRFVPVSVTELPPAVARQVLGLVPVIVGPRMRTTLLMLGMAFVKIVAR